MTPLEAMARAVDPNAWECSDHGPDWYRGICAGRRENSLRVAKAALSALAENVSQGMVEAAGKAYFYLSTDKPMRAAIRAALEKAMEEGK